MVHGDGIFCIGFFYYQHPRFGFAAFIEFSFDAGNNGRQLLEGVFTLFMKIAKKLCR